MDGSLDHVATTAVDLTDGDAFLTVDISDALSERDWVKFTVHSKTSMSEFTKGEFSVIRLHEEFRWLHDTFNENRDYEGYIIPPAPPKPDFDQSREKLRKLGDAEGNLTKEEFNKMKQELEAEYLATFKKTVAMHETFLCRLAAHPVFRFDRNLHIFLEFDKELNVRGKNKKEKLAEIWSSFHKSGDELLLGNTLKDVDEFFENERNFILDYQNQLRDSTIKSDKMILLQKYLADNYIKISQGMTELSSLNDADLAGFLVKVAEALEKMRRIDGRVASDQDLKLADTLRYHMRDTNAAKDLLYRRLRCLANYENANKNLEKARTRNREVNVAENLQTEACQRFENISAKAKDELKLLRTRRVAAFQKSLTELAELELKHSKAHAQMLRTTISALKADL
ncbi:sorting nexin-6-like [Tigriopus californicus]|uniref:sorting nexin-6-like n=1 Tax=Tigriopus californicus TaxID=6832 RepID=UPI0027D9D43F|nr:sorting nexin-6-like [Tigriopus californicus]